MIQSESCFDQTIGKLARLGQIPLGHYLRIKTLADGNASHFERRMRLFMRALRSTARGITEAVKFDCLATLGSIPAAMQVRTFSKRFMAACEKHTGITFATIAMAWLFGLAHEFDEKFWTIVFAEPIPARVRSPTAREIRNLDAFFRANRTGTLMLACEMLRRRDAVGGISLPELRPYKLLPAPRARS